MRDASNAKHKRQISLLQAIVGFFLLVFIMPTLALLILVPQLSNNVANDLSTRLMVQNAQSTAGKLHDWHIRNIAAFGNVAVSHSLHQKNQELALLFKNNAQSSIPFYSSIAGENAWHMWQNEIEGNISTLPSIVDVHLVSADGLVIASALSRSRMGKDIHDLDAFTQGSITQPWLRHL